MGEVSDSSAELRTSMSHIRQRGGKSVNIALPAMPNANVVDHVDVKDPNSIARTPSGEVLEAHSGF